MSDDQHKLESTPPADGISRREWLLNLGSAVVLSGFAGLPGKATAQSGQSAAVSLPPGLYTPSIDHVTHALNSDGPFLPIPSGSETEFVRARSGPYSPQAFSVDEFRIIQRLVEILLGEEEKPSATSVGTETVASTPQNIFVEVAEWIDLVVFSGPHVRAAARNLTPEQRALAVAYFTSEEPVRELEIYEPEKICKEGLAWLRQESRAKSAKDFLDLSTAAQVELISAMGDGNRQSTAAHEGTHFFDFLKAESIRGFYTSRIGLKELNYAGNSFYGHSPTCEAPTG